MNLRGSTEARQRLECGELAPAFRRAKAPASRTHSKRFAHNLGLRWRRWFMESEHLQNVDVSWGHEPEIRKALEIKECMFRFMERVRVRGNEMPPIGMLRGIAQTQSRLLCELSLWLILFSQRPIPKVQTPAITKTVWAAQRQPHEQTRNAPER